MFSIMCMIKLENYLSKINEDILIFGLKDVLKIFHKKYRLGVSTILKNNVDKSTYYYWIEGKSPIPVKFIKKFSELDNKIMDLAYKNMTYISAGRKKCFLPKCISEDLAYALGVVNGDGHIHKNGKYVTITVDSEEYLKKILIPIFKKIFYVEGCIINLGNYYRLEIGSKVVNSFFSMFCPIGKKSGFLRVPKEIKMNKKLLISYLSGLFDTDGCIGYDKSRTQCYFVFMQVDKNFVFEVYECLCYLGLHVNKPRVFYSPKKPYDSERKLEEWRIYIGSKKDLYEFLNKIQFLYPTKKSKSEVVKKIILDGPGRI